MRRFIPIAVAGVALVLAAPASTATSTVQIKSTGFVPAAVTINQDDSVTWTNTDTKDHQVVANGGSFASAILTKGKTYTACFPRRGDVPLPRRPPSDTEGNDHGSRCVAEVSLAVLRAGREVRDPGHSEPEPCRTQRAGETVTLTALPFGQTTKQVIATLQTIDNGAFSFNVTPR